MTAMLAFAVLLLAAVLVSDLAGRTVVSLAVIFLAGGFLSGPDMLGLLPADPDQAVLRHLADFALFAVLFSDGMRIDAGELAANWRLPARALLLGMPLTMAAIAAAAHFAAGAGWWQAALIGAVLSPTDPVFASAIVKRDDVPARLRRLLNVESGLNDGLALPAVLLLLSALGGGGSDPARLVGELLLGLLLGVALPWAAIRLADAGPFRVADAYQPLFGFAVGLLVLAAASFTGANQYWAGFSAGITTATVSPAFRDCFRGFGGHIAELLKFAAVTAFGAMISPARLAGVGVGGLVFAAAAILLARPVPLLLVLAGSELSWRERAAAAWFGPKGFASVVYGILVLRSGIVDAGHLFHLIAAAIAVSIVAHSSTDVPIAGWLRRRSEPGGR